MEAKEIVCNFMHKFVKEYWDKIDKEACEITQSKPSFLKEVKTNVDTAMWVFTEVASWGMDKEYLVGCKLELEEDYDFSVMKIDGYYIKYELPTPFNCPHTYKLTVVRPQTKTITYFE